MSGLAAFVRRDFLSLYEEARKIQRQFLKHNLPIDIVDYDEYRRLRFPPYLPSRLRGEWMRRHGVKEYRRAIFWFPYQRLELAKVLEAARKVGAEKAIFYTVTEGIAKHINLLARRLRDEYVVTPSKFSKEMIERTGLRVREVIPHQLEEPLEIDHEFGRRWRAKYPRNKKLLVYIGNPVRRKGLPELREAVEILSRRRRDFLVIVHTIDQPRLAGYSVKQLRHEHLVVEEEFGKITKPQALAKVFYSDFYVHPAKGEGFGLPVLEALQMGRPLICVNAPGVNEIASPQNSFMVERVEMGEEDYPPGGMSLIKFVVANYDPKDLAEKMDEALSAPREVLEDKIARGYEAVARFRNAYDRFVELLG